MISNGFSDQMSPHKSNKQPAQHLNYTVYILTYTYSLQFRKICGFFICLYGWKTKGGIIFDLIPLHDIGEYCPAVPLLQEIRVVFLTCL